MFCPKCKALLLPKRVDGKSVTVCSCGYSKEGSGSIAVKEKLEGPQDVTVIEKTPEVLPKVEILCKKCHHKEAYWWEQQIRAADEPATRFFKCVKCEHVWRDLKSG